MRNEELGIVTHPTVSGSAGVRRSFLIPNSYFLIHADPIPGDA